MKRFFVYVSAVCCAWAASAQVSDEEVLLTINGKPSTVGEFLYIYEKNNQETNVEKKSIDEYLDLFINFKLKVAEAESLGIDTTESFRKELAGYRSQATPKYMTSEKAQEAAIQKAYQRMQVDRKVSHIALRCPSSATAEEEQAVLDKINQARVRVTTGLTVTTGKGKRQKTVQQPAEDFNKVAVEVSDDPSVAQNEGHIGWVRPFRFVFSFEEATYNTPLGEVSEVFRTPYGFHILKVEEERAHEDIHASHIMKMTPRGNDSIAEMAKQAIDSLYEVVSAGADFAETAAHNSDDRGSAMRGGDLGFFGRGQMVPEFEEAAFALENAGDLSKPVRSQYGWHIIRLEDRRGIQPLEEIRNEISKQVVRSDYRKEIEKGFEDELKAEYGFTENRSALDRLIAAAEARNGLDSLELADMAEELFSFADVHRSLGDFKEWLDNNNQTALHIMRKAVEEKYEQYASNELRAYEDSQLERKNPELQNLITEYHDGILLFEVSLRNVWDKATTDTEGITQFFNQHKKEYTWSEPRYKGYVVYCKDQRIAKAAKQIINSAHPDSVASYLHNRLNVDSTQYVRFEKGLWKAGENKAVDKYGLKVKGADFQPSEELPVVFCIGKKLKSPEVYTDERGPVTSAYQDYLEEEWLRQLHEKYTVEVNQEVFEKLKN